MKYPCPIKYKKKEAEESGEPYRKCEVCKGYHLIYKYTNKIICENCKESIQGMFAYLYPSFYCCNCYSEYM